MILTDTNRKDKLPEPTGELHFCIHNGGKVVYPGTHIVKLYNENQKQIRWYIETNDANTV